MGTGPPPISDYLLTAPSPCGCGGSMHIVSLFDESGNMLRPWAEAGHTCTAIDILNEDGEVRDGILFLNRDLTAPEATDDLSPDIVFGFPPCTDLAVSGAMHFVAKKLRNPEVQNEAVALARVVESFGNRHSVPWFLENPVSVMSSLWRKPDFAFHPWEYGGYLPEDDVHPRWPTYIAPRDAYPKKTCIWLGNGFILPPKKPVAVEPGYSTQHRKLGGKSAKTKQIRSETPRGWARAVFEANNHS